jgi:iron complex transport system substrate-binding protein
VSRTTLLNGSLLTLAVASTVSIAWPRKDGNAVRPLVEASAPVEQDTRIATGPGKFAIADAEGTLIPLRNYGRIVSTNLVTDRLLIELCAPTRILAVSRAAAERKRDGYRYRGMDTVDGFGPVEAIVAKRPDLVLTNSFGAPGSADRMREAGIEVYDLGELRGEATFLRTVTNLGELLGAPERARRLLGGFEARFHRVAATLAPSKRKRALFLSILGPDLQGGTRGTSYHDIMIAAGLRDVAEGQYRDWPSYDAEQVLALAPDLIVTREGLGGNVCGYPGMNRLAPCRGPGRIVELPGELLDEPGLAMLDAAEELFARVYGRQ